MLTAEVENALHRMKKPKSVGPDNFKVEVIDCLFYNRNNNKISN